MLPVDGLQVVLLLLHLEDVLHEELLQVLVGVVDAELLEAVRVEVLEAEDVKDPDGALVTELELLLEDGGVDLLHDQDEQAAVDSFSEGIPNILGLIGVQGGHHGLALQTEGVNTAKCKTPILCQIEIHGIMGRRFPDGGLLEIQKMSPSTTGRCYCCH